LVAREVTIKPVTTAINIVQIGNKQFSYTTYDQLIDEPA
jgi:hypothetical protein